MHANAHNFEVEDKVKKKKKKSKKSKKTKKAKKDDTNENEVEEVGDQESDDVEVKKKKKAKKAKKAEKKSLIFSMNTVANKVMCTGTYERPGDVDDSEDDGESVEKATSPDICP